MKAWSDVFVDRMDVESPDHYFLWFELGRTFGRNRKKAKCILYKWRVERLKNKATRNEYQAELGLHANNFFKLYLIFIRKALLERS